MAKSARWDLSSRGMRMAVEHVLGMLAAGDTPEKLLAEYPFLEPLDIQACIAYAHRLSPNLLVD